MSLNFLSQAGAKPAPVINPLDATNTIQNAQNLEALLTRTFRAAEQWVVNHWLELVIALAVGFLIYAGLSYIKRRARSMAEERSGPVDFTFIALRVVGRTGRLFRIMIATMLVAGYANTPAKLYGFIVVAFTVVAVLQIAVWVREIILGVIERRAHAVDGGNEGLENAMTLIRVLVSAAVFAIAIIVILDNLGVNVTGLIAGLGVGGIAIGLAAQGIFKDLFAALSILFDKPFKTGETIKFDTMTAKVERIGLQSTRLRALDGQQVIVSNTMLLSKQLENMSKMARHRSKYILGLTYQTPTEKLRALPEKLTALVAIHNGHPVRCNFVAFNSSSIDFELIFDVIVDDEDKSPQIRHAIAMDLLDMFAAEGYELAYPTSVSLTAAPDGRLIMPYPEEG